MMLMQKGSWHMYTFVRVRGIKFLFIDKDSQKKLSNLPLNR